MFHIRHQRVVDEAVCYLVQESDFMSDTNFDPEDVARGWPQSFGRWMEMFGFEQIQFRRVAGLIVLLVNLVESLSPIEMLHHTDQRPFPCTSKVPHLCQQEILICFGLLDIIFGEKALSCMENGGVGFHILSQRSTMLHLTRLPLLIRPFTHLIAQPNHLE